MNSQNNICRNCGYKYPHTDKCPAAKQNCKGCGKAGHFIKMCRSIKVSKLNNVHNYVLNETSSSEDSHISKITADIYEVVTLNRKRRNCPRAYLCIGDNELVNHILDTGADHNIMSKRSFDAMSVKPFLRQSKARLLAFDAEKPLPIIGECTTQITLLHEANYGKTITIDYVIVDSQSTRTDNLLGYDALCELNVDFNILLKPSNETVALNNIVNATKHTKQDRYQLAEYVEKHWKSLRYGQSLHYKRLNTF